MNYLITAILLCSSFMLPAQEVHDDGRGTTYSIMPSGEMKKQVCSQLQHPFSKENLNVIYSETLQKFPKDHIYFQGSFNVNQQMALEVKKNCSTHNGSLTLFSNDSCKKSCDSEFNKLSPETLKSMVNGKKAAIEMCKKSCDAVTISYNSAVRSLTPIYQKMMALKAEKPKCYSELEILDSRKYKSFEFINDDIVPLLDSNRSHGIKK